MSVTRDEWDEQRGVWRWPEGENFVVYPVEKKDRVRVLDESTCVAWFVFEEDVDSASSVPRMHLAAARDYFKAHEPKPWLEAKPRELWEVTVGPGLNTAYVPASEPFPMQVMLDETGTPSSLFFVHWNGPDAETVDIEDEHIVTAKRLWPEVADV